MAECSECGDVNSTYDDGQLSAKAWRKVLSKEGLERRSWSVRFHEKGERIPPSGRPLEWVRVMVIPLRVREMVLCETM